jgi:glycosyltransferase involved in cell wall biosynthesis
VLGQRHQELEWLILDDGTDTAECPAELTAPGIHYLRSETRLSIGEKRNRLIDRARGEFIVHFNDDDYYAPDYVGSMLRAMMEMRCDLINLRGWFLYDLRSQFFGYWDLQHKEGPHFRCDRDGITLGIFDAALKRALVDNHLGFGFSYVFRRAVWESVKFPHVDWNEDGLFSIEASRHFRVDGFHDRRGLCLYLLHPASTGRCFPQYQIPTFVADRMFPILRGANAREY